MIRKFQLGLLGLGAVALMGAAGCSTYGDHRYGSRYDGYDNGRAHQAGYYQDNHYQDNRDTRAADRSTGLTPHEYRQVTGRESGGVLAPQNEGTTHADRVENHAAHEDHLDKEYGR